MAASNVTAPRAATRGSRGAMRRTFAGLALGLLGLESPAIAADMPVKAPASAALYNWTGFYLGGHTGYGGGSFGPDTNPIPLQGTFFPHSVTGLIGGYQAGYNRQLTNNVVLGVEADVSFLSALDRPRLAPAPFNTTADYFATARGRIGYAFGTLLPYVTGGLAWGRSHVDLNDAAGDFVTNRARTHYGWTAGARRRSRHRRQLERQARIRLHRPGATQLRARRRQPADGERRSQRPHGQARPELSAVGDAAMERGRHRAAVPASAVARLERARPDHAAAAGLSELSLALPGQPTACPAAARSARPGRSTPSSAGGCGTAASSTSIRNWRRVLASPARSALPDSPMAKRRRAAPNIRAIAPSAISSGRLSASAANRKRLPMRPISSPASATSTASP